MNIRLAIAIILAAVLAGAAGYWYGTSRSAPTPGAAPDDRTVLYWYDPMYPDRHFDAPGKSPFMDMELVPKYADEVEGAGVRIDPRTVQNLGIRTAPAVHRPFHAALEAVGTLQYDDRRVAVVQSRTDGFVERVYGHAPGDLVDDGAPLADLLVPGWAAAQREFLTLLDTGEDALVSAGRERLRLLGMPPELIRQVEERRDTHAVYTITVPLGGALRSLDVRRGMTVRAGETLARINGIDPVWLHVAVPEAQAGGVADGAPVQIRLPALPGEVLTGEVVAVLPDADVRTRTLTVRIELPNPVGRLRPGMQAQATISPPGERRALAVPGEAVIRTGQRTLVMLAVGEGRFQPAEIVPGRESGGYTEVRRGLAPGDQVVTSGQFLLDSEASLRGIPARPIAGDDDAHERHGTGHSGERP